MTSALYRVSNEEAREEHCPRCHAVPGGPCRKVLQVRTSTRRGHPRKWVLNTDAGRVMKGVHNERGRAVLMSRSQVPAHEHTVLAAWLQEHGRILAGEAA